MEYGGQRDYRERTDIKFETIKAEEVKFGKNNFIEIARKRAVTGQGESTEFIAISRVFLCRDGMKSFKISLTVPDDVDVIEFVCNSIKAMSSGKKAAAETADVEQSEQI